MAKPALDDFVRTKGATKGDLETLPRRELDASPRKTAKRISVRPVLIPMASIAAEEISWLWRGRLARGKVTLLIGDPGLGKSFVTLDMASRLSNGREWPDGDQAPLGVTILLSAEDGPADT